MERVDFFHKAITETMRELTARFSSSDAPQVTFHSIIDENHRYYQLMAVGWIGHERIFNIFFQADIINDKIWIQQDNTEESIAVILEEKGVSKKDIVLAYFPEYHREHTEYAVK